MKFSIYLFLCLILCCTTAIFAARTIVTTRSIPLPITPAKSTSFSTTFNSLYIAFENGFYWTTQENIVAKIPENTGSLVSSGSYSGTFNLYKITANNGASTSGYTCAASSSKGIYYASNNFFGSPKEISSTPASIPEASAFISGGAQFIISFDYSPYRLYQIYFGGVKFGAQTYNTAPSDLVCDFIALRCMVISDSNLDIYVITTNAAPVPTRYSLTAGTRANGVVNNAKTLVYYIRTDSSTSFTLEAYSYTGSLAFSKSFPNTALYIYGSFIKMAFDNIQGQLMIATQNYIIFCDWQGQSNYLIPNPVNDVFVGLDVMLQNVQSDNDNYLLITTPSSIYPIKYDSYKYCNYGYSSYGTCVCNKGGDSDCFFAITSATTADSGENLEVTLGGSFQNPSPQRSEITIYVGDKIVDTANINSISTNEIKFIVDFYSPSSLITLTMNGQNSTFQSTIYPDLTLAYLGQVNEILTFSGIGLKSFIPFKAVFPDQDNLEVNLNFINSTAVSLELSLIDSNQMDFSIIVDNSQPQTFSIDVAPYLIGNIPSQLSDKGNSFDVTCYYINSNPHAFINDKTISVTAKSGNVLNIQIPAGYYENLTLGNGVKNITLPLSYNTLSIESVEQTNIQELTITASEFGIDQNQVVISLSNEGLTISGFDPANGVIKVVLTDESLKGELLIEARQTKTINVNLKPNITSITPINPSYKGQTITINGLYLSTNVEFNNNNNEKSFLDCSELTTTSISCDIPQGTGLFTITSISKLLDANDSKSNIYKSEYEKVPVDSSSSESPSESSQAGSSQSTSQGASSESGSSSSSQGTTSSPTTSSPTTSSPTTSSPTTSSPTTSSPTTSSPTSSPTTSSSSTTSNEPSVAVLLQPKTVIVTLFMFIFLLF
ncbi:hypothetical protein CYY_000881 [Polysphondylium violaceum]|uniref:IPT/TIG domain-containing protein n=1 Tax=Polysphondylium violaceum TaxID=133409 RepID=A0A8J4UWS4_9MYCE|nr:hypothetical protein CYY_000881 [Polysphondylium violaceum]